MSVVTSDNDSNKYTSSVSFQPLELVMMSTNAVSILSIMGLMTRQIITKRRGGNSSPWSRDTFYAVAPTISSFLGQVFQLPFYCLSFIANGTNSASAFADSIPLPILLRIFDIVYIICFMSSMFLLTLSILYRFSKTEKAVNIGFTGTRMPIVLTCLKIVSVLALALLIAFGVLPVGQTDWALPIIAAALLYFIILHCIFNIKLVTGTLNAAEREIEIESQINGRHAEEAEGRLVHLKKSLVTSYVLLITFDVILVALFISADAIPNQSAFALTGIASSVGSFHVLICVLLLNKFKDGLQQKVTYECTMKMQFGPVDAELVIQPMSAINTPLTTPKTTPLLQKKQKKGLSAGNFSWKKSKQSTAASNNNNNPLSNIQEEAGTSDNTI